MALRPIISTVLSPILAIAFALGAILPTNSSASAMPIITSPMKLAKVDANENIVKVGRRHRHRGHRGHRGHRRHHRRHRNRNTAAAIVLGAVVIGSLIAADRARRDDRYYDDRRYRSRRYRVRRNRVVRHRHACRGRIVYINGRAYRRCR